MNYDETNFTDDAGRFKVVVRRSCKRSEQVMDTSKAATSATFSCSASGTIYLYILYTKRIIFGPLGPRMVHLMPGTIEANRGGLMAIYLKNDFSQSLPDGPKALIGDNSATFL